MWHHVLLHDSEVCLDQDRPITQLDIPDTVRLRRDFSTILTDPLETMRIDLRIHAPIASQNSSSRMRRRVGEVAALGGLRHSSESEEVLEEGTQQWEVAGDDGDAHFHESPAAGVYLSVSCIVPGEIHDGDDSDGACDADAMSASAKFLNLKEGHIQTTKHKNSDQSNLPS
jgi:hypothetical protein